MTSITRREALQFAAAITLAAMRPQLAMGMPAQSNGYGTDPTLLTPVATWSRILTEAQRALFTALCDIVLPAAGAHPSASQVGVVDFLDEWVSAPYPAMQRDCQLLMSGAAELDRRMQERYATPFANASAVQQREIFESLFGADLPLRNFPARVVNLISGGYYTTTAGYADMGYVGNRAMAVFPAPAANVIQQIDAAIANLAKRW
jgi:hypothetical protein